MKWPDLLGRPRPLPTTTVAYGADPLQVVDLWLPKGRGPHPTVLMVHGGCWQSEIADRTIMNWIADDLRSRGIAVWNIDYRGVDRGVWHLMTGLPLLVRPVYGLRRPKNPVRGREVAGVVAARAIATPESAIRRVPSKRCP